MSTIPTSVTEEQFEQHNISVHACAQPNGATNAKLRSTKCSTTSCIACTRVVSGSSCPSQPTPTIQKKRNQLASGVLSLAKME